MAASQDTEITLGTGKILALFFGLVAVCALFFGLGYSLGRKSEPGVVASGPVVALPASSGARPTGAKPAEGNAAQPQNPMTFYKAVEQKDASPQMTPAADAKDAGSTNPADSGASKTPEGVNPPDPTITLPSSSYYVQVAAVTKEDDAEALVDALKKKQYPALVPSTPSTDKLFRVQVGPFSDIKEAEAMRARLISDGYNPILKK